jgi:hypothetical protein
MANIEAIRKRLIGSLEAAGAKVFFWNGAASTFEAEVKARIFGARQPLQ